MAYVFLCYAKADLKKVDKIYISLTEAGFNVWMDKYDLHGGDLWRKKIPKIIKNASVFIACYSKHFIENISGYRDEEVYVAMETAKNIPCSDSPYFIPILLDNSEVPRTIRSTRHVIEVKSRTGVKQLIAGLSFCRRFPRKSTIPPVIDNAMRLSIEYKERGRDQVITWAREYANDKTWNWHCLGRALEYYLDAIKYWPRHQHPWTNIAYVYHLIGKATLAEWCLARSIELAEPGRNHPGRNCKQVMQALNNGATVYSKRLMRKKMPEWFRKKNADLLAETYGRDTFFRGVSYYIENWPPKDTA